MLSVNPRLTTEFAHAQNLITAATFPFLGVSVSPSHFLETLQIVHLMLKFVMLH